MSGWAVSVDTGEVADLHCRSAASVAVEPVRRGARFWHPVSPALVLGSTQPASVVAAGTAVPVVRRRTGGAAVYVAPGELVWVDVVIPAGDPCWTDDVGRAFWWVGEVWAAALATVLAEADRDHPAVAVHRGATIRTEWSPLVCFGGLGSGEITLDGSKVVGISQRRTRRGAVFQCAALLHWEPHRLLNLLELTAGERSAAARDLRTFATGLGLPGAAVETAFTRALQTHE